MYYSTILLPKYIELKLVILYNINILYFKTKLLKLEIILPLTKSGGLKMRIVSLDNLRNNEILGKTIYNDIGAILLAQGAILTPEYIRRLRDIGILSVYIDDNISEDVVLTENISENTRQMSKQAIKNTFEKYNANGKISNDGIEKSVDSIIDDILANKDVMINVSDIRAKDDKLYSHSVNVCVLCTVTGIHMGYNMVKLRDLAVGAILHDIGKVRILNDKKIKFKLSTTNGF